MIIWGPSQKTNIHCHHPLLPHWASISPLMRCANLRAAIQSDFQKLWQNLVIVRDALQDAIDKREASRLILYMGAFY